MRDILVVGICVIGALMALRRPWIGVLLWTWISVMNPHRYCWGFAYDAPVAAMAAGSTLFGLLLTRERRNPFSLGAPAAWLLLFMLWMTLSWLLGYGFNSADILASMRDYDLWNRVIKTLFMTFVALALLHNRLHILAFAWVFAMSLGILGIKGGLFTVASGGSYRVWGPAGSFIYDNNEFALALITIIPLLHFLQLQSARKWVRHGLTLAMLLCAAAALGSRSRGALVALAAMGGLLWWRSRRKGMMAVAILAVLAMVLLMMPEEWWERMRSIFDPAADNSALGRLRAWKVAIQVALHHATGAGMVYLHPVIFYMWDSSQGDPIAAHSVYFQILGNHGFIGLFLYLMMGVLTFRYAGWLRRHARAIPEAQWAADLGAMAQVSMAGFAVGGAFLSLAYVDIPFDIMVLVLVTRRWVQTRGWEHDPRMGFLEYCGLRRSRARPRARPSGSGQGGKRAGAGA
ncbi:MAG: putative O-glycosylation ligase, exosortase A system-associated [Azoarcus sp.]|jgi:probable O-glycosylation ligase (exosortase A-associated)|nr:putative O-glycosylation ligase, exosortase A system-associated [Azoarcus sp.]